MADKFGIKRIFIIAIGIFTLSSLGCGFARHLPELVLLRSIQGLGGAFTTPIGRLILLRLFPRRDFVALSSRAVMVASFGMMLGPVLGGLITHYFSWRWIFWVNVPVGILAILLALKFLPKVPAQVVAPLDIIGFVLFGVGLAGFIFGLSAFSQSMIPAVWIWTIIGTAIGILSVYVWHSRRISHPIVNTQLFHIRAFQISSMGNVLSRLGFSGLPFLLPILLQVALGYSSQISGLLLAPLALGIFFVKLFVLKLLRHFGYKKILILNTLLVAFSLWTFMAVNQTTPYYEIGFFTFLFGVLVSTQFTAMNTLSYAEIPETQLSAATSIMGTLQQLTQSFGVALGAFLIRVFSIGSGKEFMLTPWVFHRAFFMMGVVTLGSIAIFLRLRPEDGRQMLEDSA
jgi:EmrB/QacA subfamily drug resistance transporter